MVVFLGGAKCSEKLKFETEALVMGLKTEVCLTEKFPSSGISKDECYEFKFGWLLCVGPTMHMLTVSLSYFWLSPIWSKNLHITHYIWGWHSHLSLLTI